MKLNVGPDAAYVVAPKAKSRITGHFYFNNIYVPTNKVKVKHHVLIECRCLHHIVTSTAESVSETLFHNLQRPTPLITDNTVANGFVHNNIHLNKRKTWDMRYYFLKYKQTQKKTKVYWKRGKDEYDSNCTEDYTNNHTTIHHKGVM